MARRRREEVKFKALATGGEGRTTRVQARSAYGQNRSNVKRKPAARRTSPFKKMMRKQTISREVADEMKRTPGVGDHRRTVAERAVARRARKRLGTHP
jgi:hypothetical protein